MVETGCFYLSGQFDPDEITEQLGIEPTWYSRIGDPGPPGANGSRRGAEWCLSSYIEGCGDDGDYGEVEFQISTLVDRLRSKSAIVAQLSEKFNGTIKLVAYLDGSFPGFFLPPYAIREVAALNVDVDCRYIYATKKDNEGAEDAN